MNAARGIVLLIGLAARLGAQPTYAKEISRIIQHKCQMCHRPNDIAPFALMTYDDAARHWREIRAAVDSRIMPPWKPIPDHGDFKGTLRLSDEDRQTILDWVDAGLPQGDPADAPPDVFYTDEWRLGYPDQIVSMPVPYTPVARDDRPDRYRCFLLPSAVDQDRWVRAVDILPGARQLVHHVILYLTDDPAQINLARKFDEEEDPDPGYDCWGGPRIAPGAGPGLIKQAGGMLGGWVPGASVQSLSSDIGILVPKGAYIVMQVHYHLAGVDVVPDQSRIGLYFQSSPPKNRLLTLPLINDTFVLEPGDVDKEADISFTLDTAAFGLPLPDALVPKFSAIRIAPHMHTLGHQIGADMFQPDTTRVPLIQIDDWDFHWQGFYDFVNPVPMPYRSTIKAACKFDNTTDHEVRWGESTEDEMCLIFVGFTAEGGVAPLLFGNPQ